MSIVICQLSIIDSRVLYKVQSYINSQNLLTPDSTLIVGLSGGADSVALLYILKQLGYNCVAAHCNFHLRGEESLRDETFAQSFAESLQIPFLKIDFDTETYACKQGISIEMVARELRYDWFKKLRNELNAEAIVVGHHQNDSIETVLLNLIRGTGIHGLTGIKPKSGHIVRPLLCLTKEEILSFIRQQNLSYVTDSTNCHDDYVRNKIRLNILPAMKEINPSVENAILRTMENLRQAAKVYDSDIELSRKKVFDEEKGYISIPALQSYIEPEAILYEILKPFGFNSTVVGEIMQSLTRQAGKEFYASDFKLIKDRDKLLLTTRRNIPEKYYEIAKDDISLHHPLRLSLHFTQNIPEFEMRKDKNIAYFDALQLKFPLTLRRWKQGDKFVPFGMQGFRKLSDYFNDRKFSKIAKEQAWLLCSRNDIIWIVGERPDNRFCITETTQKICIVKIS